MSRTKNERPMAKRTSRISASVIREMTRMAEHYNALNLAQGFADFSAPADVKEAATKAIDQDYNQYASTWGSQNLRKAVAEKARWFNGLEVDPDSEVTVTCGSTEAIMAATMAVADSGDDVIYFEPAYENYRPSAIFAGANPKPVPLGPSFKLDEESLKRAFSPRAAAIVVNSPHNPSGKVFDQQELRTIADLCEDYGTIAITDEIYEHILYDGKSHTSLATVGDMRERTVTISGISKTFTVTGWRIGYAVAPGRITDAIRKVHDYMTVCAPAPFQEAAAFALRRPKSYYADLAKSYQKKKDFIVGALREIGFKFVEPQGAYYILADFGSLSHDDDVTFSTKLTKDGGVAVVPGSSFYEDGKKGRSKVRFSFSKKDSTLEEAADRMRKYFN